MSKIQEVSLKIAIYLKKASYILKIKNVEKFLIKLSAEISKLLLLYIFKSLRVIAQLVWEKI